MDIYNMLAFLFGGGITLTSFIILVGKLFPIPVIRTADAIKASWWKPFLLGLVNAVFFILLASLMFNYARSLSGFFAGVVALLALAIFAALGILGSIGLSAFNFWFEERIDNGGGHTFTTSLKSALLLVLACMAPFVGWFLLTPFVIATSLGAAIQSVLRRKEKVV